MFVEDSDRGIVVVTRHLLPRRIELPARAAPHAGAVRFIIQRERGAHLPPVRASEDPRQPVIRG